MVVEVIAFIISKVTKRKYVADRFLYVAVSGDFTSHIVIKFKIQSMFSK